MCTHLYKKYQFWSFLPNICPISSTNWYLSQNTAKKVHFWTIFSCFLDKLIDRRHPVSGRGGARGGGGGLLTAQTNRHRAKLVQTNRPTSPRKNLVKHHCTWCCIVSAVRVTKYSPRRLHPSSRGSQKKIVRWAHSFRLQHLTRNNGLTSIIFIQLN